MKLVAKRRYYRAITAAAAILALSGGALVAIADPASATATPPPWVATEQTEHEAAGTVSFYNSSGVQIFSGPLSGPLAAFAVASGGLPGASVASAGVTAYMASPQLGEPASFFEDTISASAAVPYLGTLPSPLTSLQNAGHLVVPVQLGYNDYAADGNVSTYPSWTTTYEVRIQGSDVSSWYSADIQVDTVANTWTQVYPAQVASAAPGSYQTVSPTRLLDTRSGKGGSGPVAANGTVHLQVTGGVVPAGVSAVVLNVTVTAPAKAGNIAAYPDLTSEPTVSNLNFVAGQTIPNLVVVGVGSDGKVALTNNSSGTVQLIADVAGYYVGGGTPSVPGAYQTVSPTRLLDTRSGKGGSGPVAANGTVHLQVTGGVVPAGVSAVVLNVTVTAPAKAGNIAAYPDLTSEPTVSNLNFVAGQTIPNLVVVGVGSDGKVALTNNSSGTVQLIADVAGYYVGGGTPSVPGAYQTVSPTRLLDTRSGKGGSGPVAANGTVHLQVTGGVVPAGVSAVVLNVTVTAPAKAGNIAAYPDLTSEPTVSNLNFVAGQTIPNLVVVGVGSDGKVALTNNSSGTVQLIADVAGYYLGSG